MPFPPPPVNTIDWDHIGFQVHEVNGHIESHFSKNSGKWTQPEFIEDPYLRIHGMAPALNYAQQAFEGVKAFRTPDDSISIFRPSQNAKRLIHSAGFVSIPPVPEALFLQCLRLAVGLNAEFVPPYSTGSAMYIRPVLFGSSAHLGLTPPEEYTFCVYVMPTGVFHGVHPVAALIMEDFDRAAPNGTGSAKLGGNYAPVLKWSDKAREEGFGITLHLDSKTGSEIDEFSTSGFIGVHKKGDHFTLAVPDSKCVIKSVTSDSVCELARSLGWTVECRPIKYEEISTFSEIIAAGTAAALVPIKSITMHSRNDRFIYQGGGDEIGPACVKLLTALKDIQRGKAKDPFGWRDIVGEPKGYKGEALTKGLDAMNDTNGTKANDHVDKLV